ncbi:hypothetical protein L7F22_035869 [Adiantum nelumboides]|nr:hypothetical protein [Adiantum nelumboides]
MGSSNLRQSAITARMGVCFTSLDSNADGFSGLESRSSALLSEEDLFTAQDLGAQEMKARTSDDLTAGRNIFMSLHNLLTNEEESSSSSEKRPYYAEWPQLSSSRRSRGAFSTSSQEGNDASWTEVEGIMHSTDFDHSEESMIDDNSDAGGEAHDKSGLHSPGRRARKKAKVMGLLLEGKHPIEVLSSLPEWAATEFWTLINYLTAEKRFGEALQVFAWWRGQKNYIPREKHFVTFIRMLGLAKRPDISQLIFDQMKALGLQPGLPSYTALLDSYAEACCFNNAEALARKLLECEIKPNAATFNGLMLAYFKQGSLDNMNKLLNNMKRWGCLPDYRTYRCMIVAYANAGLFRRMESMWREMDKNDWKLDFPIINAILRGYAAHGLVNEMHASYLRIKDYRVLVSKVTIRAMASAYIRTSKFYQLRTFVKDLGLLRKDLGSLMWNLLLMAFAANFQVKNMQRSCLGMEMAGFTYDLTTCNICLLCYARMKMLWEIHALLIRMRKLGMAPDLVSFGAVVDAYIFGRERFQKMFMELDELGLKSHCPDVKTDPLVFQAFGKGDFHSSSETLMQINPKPYGKRWTYGLLLSFYLKKRGARRTLHIVCETKGSRFVAKKFFFKRSEKPLSS